MYIFIKKRVVSLVFSSTMIVSLAATPLLNVSAVEGLNNDLAVESTETENNLRLWYTKPASQGEYVVKGTDHRTGESAIWQQYTLPIGNGDMGANIYGEIQKEHITFNEKTLWTGGPSTKRSNYNGGNLKTSSNGKTMLENLKEVQRLFALHTKEGDTQASKLSDQLVGTKDGYGAYQAWGDIYFDFEGISENEVSNYVRDLDMKNAVSSVQFNYKDTDYEREYLASNPDKVIAMKLTATGSNKMNFKITFPSKQGGTPVAQGDILTLKGEVSDNQMKYNSQIKAVVQDGAVEAKESYLQISDASEVVIYVAAATDYKNEYPKYRTGESADELNSRVFDTVTAAAEKGYNQIKADHIADYQSIFNRVDLNIGQESSLIPTDTLLNQYKNGTATEGQQRDLEVMLFQYGRYLTLGCSRADSQLPSNLQGVWNNENQPAWASDYHLNVNLQMNYWPVFSTNMEESAIPLVNYVESLRIPGRITAEYYAGIKSEEGEENGFMAHTQNTPFGWTCPGWNFSWGWSPAAVPWILQNVYDMYAYNGDLDYLRSTIYPMLKEETKLYDGMLIWDETQQRLVSSPTYSPEHGPRTVGNTYEQTLIWQLYQDAISAAKALGVDEDKVAQWTETQSKLKPVQIGTNGQLKEWFEETAISSVASNTSTHRHLSHLLGLFPGDLISVDTPKSLKAATISLDDRTDVATGWGMGQRINAWARTGDGNHAYMIIQNLFKTGIYSNLWDTHPPFQIDGNFGMTSGVAEMLLQSNLGYINILPALPDAWSTGNVKGLVAEGNFVTDITWKNQNATEISILSRNGGECVVKYNNLSIANVTTKDGTLVPVNVINKEKISFDTQQGETYVINNISTEESALAAPTGLKVYRISSEQTQLNWDTVTAVEDGTVSYNVYRQIGDGEFRLLTKGITKDSYTDESGDELLGELRYKVCAVFGLGENGVKKTALTDPVVVSDLRNVDMLDDRSSMISYTGEWKTYDGDSKDYNKTQHYIDKSVGGETIELTFLGTGIDFISQTNNTFTSVNFYMDGEKVTTEPYSLATSSSKGQVVKNVANGLEFGVHTLKVVVTGAESPLKSGSSKIAFDAFRVLNDNKKAVNEITVKSNSGANMIFSANSTILIKAEIIPEDAENKAVTWSVDNEELASIDENGLLTAKEKSGVVTVTAKAKDGSDIKGSQEISIQLDNQSISVNVDDNDMDSGIQYSGDWELWDKENKHYKSTVHETSTEGGTITYVFTGTGIEIYVAKNKTYGSVSVSIDGEEKGVYSTYSDAASGLSQQLLESFTGLENGSHTIVLTTLKDDKGKKIQFDYFKVLSQSVDKSELGALLSQYDAVKASRYNQESFDAYKEKVEQAVTVINNLDATVEDVTNALQALQLAQDALIKKSEADEPGNPQNLVVIGAEAKKIWLKWNPPTDGAEISRYEIYIQENGESKKIGDSENTYFKAEGLSPETAYEFTVKTLNDSGVLSAGESVSVTTMSEDGEMVVEKPENMELRDISEASATITWKMPESTWPIVNYEVYLNGKMVVRTKELNYTFENLTTNVTYSVKVRAIDEDGNVSLPATVQFKTEQPVIEQPETVPGKPENLTAQRTEDSCVKLEWKGVDQAHIYYIYRSAKEEGEQGFTEYKKIGESATPDYVDNFTQAPANWYYKVQAGNNAGVSELSEAIRVVFGSNQVLITNIAILPSTNEIEVGNSLTLKYTYEPSNAIDTSVTWSTSDTKIATVDQAGKVTGVSKGKVKITCTANDSSKASASFEITVVEVAKTVLAQSITLDQSNLELGKEETSQLKAAILPDNTTNKAISWTSSNEKVAKVNENGKVTSVGFGNAQIKAVTQDGSNQSAICKMTVGYKIKYVLKGGNNSDSNPDAYYKQTVKLKNPTRKNYSFKGWYTDKNYKNSIKQISKKDAKNYTVYAKWEKVKVDKVKISKLESESKKTLNVVYDKISEAKGYEITYATNKKFSENKNVLTTSSSSKKINKLESKKKYYVKVRAYKLDSVGNKVYGKSSAVKSLKIK